MRSKNITQQAKQVWRYLFERPWPRSWLVRLVPYSELRGSWFGETWVHKQEIRIANDPEASEMPLETLIHEFLHMLGWRRHTWGFYQRETALRAKLSMPPRRDPDKYTAQFMVITPERRQLRYFDVPAYLRETRRRQDKHRTHIGPRVCRKEIKEMAKTKKAAKKMSATRPTKTRS